MSPVATHWVIVPAAGRGMRFGGEVPKQYLQVAGRSVLAHTLHALLSHPRIAGAVVALAADDAYWPGLSVDAIKPLIACVGGASRAESVLAGLCALPADVGAEQFVLVHDGARPNLAADDLERLCAACAAPDAVGAILAAPVRDTLKRAAEDGSIAATEARERLWRAFTPQMFRRGQLTLALAEAVAQGVEVTDEAMAIERLGLHPRLVEGREDNFKITTPTDLARFAFALGQR